MKIKKKNLEVVFNVFNMCDVPSLKEGRIRDAFIRNIYPSLQGFYIDRQKIVEKFCEKDAEGNPIVAQDDKKQTFNFGAAEQVAVTKELDEFLNEEIEIEVENPTKLKELVEFSTYKPMTGETDLLDEFLAML